MLAIIDDLIIAYEIFSHPNTQPGLAYSKLLKVWLRASRYRA